jgi:hypothetical protein
MAMMIRQAGALAIAFMQSTGLSAQSEIAPVARTGLCVTNGVVEPAPGGLMRVDTPSSRAVAPASDGRFAEVRFRYIGPSAGTKPLASGELRRQVGLKLKAQDTCNLVYAMWHIEPDQKVAVSVKRNPGMSTHAACGAHGYVNVRPDASAEPAPVKPGEWHVLRAELRGAALTVIADGSLAWRGVLPPVAEQFDGPSGLRTDNARFDFAFSARSGRQAAAVPCRTGAGD